MPVFMYVCMYDCMDGWIDGRIGACGRGGRAVSSGNFSISSVGRGLSVSGFSPFSGS